MPYKNIVFAKLEKRLLNDHRWFGMSETAQLLYIKLILMAAQTYNKIPAKIELIMSLARTNSRKSTILKALKEIEENFPKFRKVGDFYEFEDFEEKTNYIRASQRQSEGTPKEVVYIDKDKEEEKEKDKERKMVVGEREIIIKEYFLDLLPINSVQPFIEAWAEWVDFRKEIRHKLTKSTAKKQLQFLLKQPNPADCISQSIEKGWQGLFEVELNRQNGLPREVPQSEWMNFIGNPKLTPKQREEIQSKYWLVKDRKAWVLK